MKKKQQEEILKAPLHYHARGENARFTAYLIGCHLYSDILLKAKKELPYSGTPEVAVCEAFCRESSTALELVTKAVIAQKIESGTAQKHVTRVRLIHDLVGLWQDAELPRLKNDDQRALLFAREVLMWAGRYGAPIKLDKLIEYLDEDERLEFSNKPSGKIRIRKGGFYRWERVNRIYKIANDEFWRSRQHSP